MQIKKINKTKIISFLLCLIAVFNCLPFSFSIIAQDNNSTLTTYSFNTASDADVASTHILETVSFVDSEYPGVLMIENHGDFSCTPTINDFFDYNGYYTVAYSSDANLYIERYTTEPKLKERITIAKKYPLVGDVICDSKGNYFVIWGKYDTVGKGGVDTIAVSKYSYSGAHIKTNKYVTPTTGLDTSTACKEPFVAGSCVSIITSDGELLVSYAKQMYIGHQCNEILRIKCDTMENLEPYNNYASHSLDEWIMELDEGGICIANKSDYYTERAYCINFYNATRTDKTSFHFFGVAGGNKVYSSMAGLVEVNKNIYLVASSAKSMTKDAEKEAQNLFIQLITDEDKTIDGATSRSGYSMDAYKMDNKILWLTDYTAPYTVSNPTVVEIDKDRFVIMWEKVKVADKAADSEFVQSYYMVINANGTIIKDAEEMGGIRLTSHEAPEYNNGYIYWTTAGTYGKITKEFDEYYVNGYGIYNGKKLQIHKLDVSDIEEPNLEAPEITSLKSDASGITVSWNKVPNAPKYKIMRMETTSSAWSVVGTTSKTTFIDTTAPACKYYKYAVVCTNSTGKMNMSPVGYFDEEVKCVCFDDVPESSWYTDAVVYCVNNSYFSGTSERKFSPQTQMTRAMFVQILYALDGAPAIKFKGTFSDVPSNAWYAKAVEWAAGFGVTGGIGGGLFGPNNKVSREQLATFLYSYAKNKGYNVSASTSVDKYADASKISSWAKTAIQWAVAEGFVSGLNATTLAPKNIATRAQTAVIFKAFVLRYSK